jgi:hypothetical protein
MEIQLQTENGQQTLTKCYDQAVSTPASYSEIWGSNFGLKSGYPN